MQNNLKLNSNPNAKLVRNNLIPVPRAVLERTNHGIPLTQTSTTKSHIKELFEYYKFLEFSLEKIREALYREYNSNSKKIINDTYMMIESNTYMNNIDTFNNNLIKILKNISPELYGCFIYLTYYKESYLNSNYENKKNVQESSILKGLIDLGKNIELVNINYINTQKLERTNTPLPYYGTTTQSFVNAVTNKFKFIGKYQYGTLNTGNTNINSPYTYSKLIKILTNISPELYGKIIYVNLYLKSVPLGGQFKFLV